MGLKYLSNIGKNAAKTVGSFALGFLPEQEYFEKKISWYNADKGVLLSGLVELTLGPIILSVGAFTDNNLLTGIGGFEFAQAFGYRVHDDLWDNFNRKKTGEIHRNYSTPLGNLALEIPYRFLKNVFRRDDNVEGLSEK
jgi:hypothetical protein